MKKLVALVLALALCLSVALAETADVTVTRTPYEGSTDGVIWYSSEDIADGVVWYPSEGSTDGVTWYTNEGGAEGVTWYTNGINIDGATWYPVEGSAEGIVWYPSEGSTEGVTWYTNEGGAEGVTWYTNGINIDGATWYPVEGSAEGIVWYPSEGSIDGTSINSSVSAETADVTGTWYLNEVSVDGMSVNPSIMGVDMTLTLNADGTFSMNLMGEVYEGAWSTYGNIVSLIGKQSFTLADGNLTGELNGFLMTLSQEKAVVETYVPGEAKVDATMADYNGTWNATMADMFGMQLPMESLDMTMQIIVADGKMTVLEGMGEEISTSEGTATVENGALSMMIEGATEVTTVQLYTDGVLALAVDMGDDLAMTFYFEKAAE